MKVEAAQLTSFEGRYELKNNRLYSLADGLPDEEFVPLSATIILIGTVRPFRQGTQSLNGMKSIQFAHSESVAGRKIIRHDSEIHEIVSYHLSTDGSPRYVLVYLDQEGLVADCDVVVK